MNESIHGERIASELEDRVTELIEQQTAISEVPSDSMGHKQVAQTRPRLDST
jgi:hypothetical protein